MLGAMLASAQTISVETLRSQYYKLDTDSAACAKLYAKLQKAGSDNNLINGYKGAVTAAMANHAKSREEKIKLFTAGKKLIEQSVKTDSANVELRFLRFTIQTNCPKALGYYKQLTPDKKYIIAHLQTLKNPALQSKISDYLLAGNHLDAEEKKQLKSAR